MSPSRPAGLNEGERAAMVARALDDWQAGFPAEKKGAPMTLAQIFGLARAMFDAGLAASVSPVSVEGERDKDDARHITWDRGRRTLCGKHMPHPEKDVNGYYLPLGEAPRHDEGGAWCWSCLRLQDEARALDAAPPSVEGEDERVERWMVDYEHGDDEPQHAVLSWLDDEANGLPEVGTTLVRASDYAISQQRYVDLRLAQAGRARMTREIQEERDELRARALKAEAALAAEAARDTAEAAMERLEVEREEARDARVDAEAERDAAQARLVACEPRGECPVCGGETDHVDTCEVGVLTAERDAALKALREAEPILDEAVKLMPLPKGGNNWRHMKALAACRSVLASTEAKDG